MVFNAQQLLNEYVALNGIKCVIDDNNNTA